MTNLFRNGLVLVLLLCLITLAIQAQSEKRRLLLVCSDDSVITSVSYADIRKIFLGIPTSINGVRVRPLINESDELITEVFLQKIIYMSRPVYERQLVMRVFRFGGQRPEVFNDLSDLVNELNQAPESVTYMWSDQISMDYKLKTLNVLWGN